jgi:ribonuclease-3
VAGDPLKLFQQRLGARFRQRALLETALTHRSYANEQGLGDNYERLEFLGDAVLGLVTGEWLYSRYPDVDEGGLSELKAYLVSRAVLAGHATRMEVGSVLRLGVGEERSGGREKESILADALESVIGAVYLDRGLKQVYRVLEPLLESALEERRTVAWAQAKGRLQELAQAEAWGLPDYRLIAETGPDHEKRFTVECWVNGSRVGVAEAGSKKIAEQRAAALALDALIPE